MLSAPNYPEIEVQYTDCAVGSTCTKTFTLTETLPAPVYFYYGFKGFYQNHRRYLKYFSSTQLDTGVVDSAGVSFHILRFQLIVGISSPIFKPLALGLPQWGEPRLLIPVLLFPVVL